MKVNLIIGVFTVAAIAMFASSGHAAVTKLSKADLKFASDATQINDFEIAMGRYAAANSANAEVKAFGSKMVDEHTGANEELQKVAVMDGFKLPKSISLSLRLNEARLKMLKGSAFDKAYLSEMVKGHTAAAKEFKKEVASGTSPDVKSFAKRTLPTVEHHLAMAKTELNALESGKKPAMKGKM